MSLSRLGAVALIVWGQSASAQSSGLTLPAEFPPTSYTANQYVDSTGCTFIRAGLSGAVTWVPRVNRDRTPLCGFQPSLPGGTNIAANAAANAAAVANAPIIDIPSPVPQVAVADVGPPMDTVASLTTPPPPVPPAAVSPRIIDLPAVPAAVITPPVAAAPVPALTRAGVCAGRTGIQAGYVSSITGLPLDCGGNGAAAPPATPAQPQLRMTLAQICADMDATGQRYMNAATGLPVRCGPQTQPILTAGVPAGGIGGPAGPATPAAPVAPSLAAPAITIDQPARVNLGGQEITLAALCQISDATGTRYINATNGLPVRCGPQVQSPSGLTAPFGGALVARSAPVPALAPVPPPQAVARAAPVSPPPGYAAVWDDGRLNPNRGLPEGNAQALVPSAPTLTLSSMTVPQVVTSGHRYVQVGTFADPANADRSAALLQGLGLPVGFASVTRNGQPLRIVAAGPFADAASLQAALQAARNAGFGDAYTRN